MKAAQIRRLFLDFFVGHGHREVPSSSLLPADDPTLLFTNAGMNQFKRVFLGMERREYHRATTCQKCVRAGGKHNDLEQVGHTTRHHTFFEMLGNFSFGDYFKREAISFAWQFVTSKNYLGLDPMRLRVTVHHSDDEARRLWREISDLPDHRIYGLGDKDNFWQMGDTGPCGPCTEIYVDLRPLESHPHALSERRKEVIPQAEFERLAESGEMLEIWNLVFMQYDRSADGKLNPLPKPSVDTGAGLERIAAVMQGEDSNFHTDLFMPLIRRVAELVGKPYDRGPGGASYRVLADHARAVTFLLTDGIYPSNEGRGYVLRRILRRAVRHAWLLGRKEPTLAPLTEVVVREMGDAYPELHDKAGYVLDVTRQEEERFLETIEGGLKRLEEIFASGVKVISGAEAFKLYDTFGFPIDLTQIIAEERGLTVDLAEFEAALAEQRERSREVHKAAKGPTAIAAGTGEDGGEWTVVSKEPSRFVGYQQTEADTEVLAFRRSGAHVELLLRDNPFYAEAGGQISDTGSVAGKGWVIPVTGVRKDPRGQVLLGTIGEGFEPGSVRATVDRARRRDIERNHSATHLLHWALRKHLGTHVRQQGSLVEAGRLRFDFSHHGPIEPEMLDAIEREVYEQVLENWAVDTREMPYNDALKLGAMAFFSEKYGDRVRVVQMGPSLELCGGTHVRTTGQLGLFKLAGQGGVAAGVRRVEAITGEEAYTTVVREEELLEQVAESLRAHPDQVLRKLEQVRQEKERLEARMEQMLKSGVSSAEPQGETKEIRGVTVTIGDTQTEDRDEVAALADRFREGRKKAVLVLLSPAGRGAVHVAVTDDLVKAGKKAGDLVNRIAQVSGGKGGGRPGFASAGAGDPAKLGAARAAAPALIEAWLSA
ncbi:MAG TPA: alanine--tRNA ligase [Gemmatimonadales bacterium]|nr:alanine--tRNA ligase [Gemmatimonadales bacterium]